MMFIQISPRVVINAADISSVQLMSDGSVQVHMIGGGLHQVDHRYYPNMERLLNHGDGFAFERQK